MVHQNVLLRLWCIFDSMRRNAAAENIRSSLPQMNIRSLRPLKLEEQMRVSRLPFSCVVAMLWTLMAGAQETGEGQRLSAACDKVEIPLSGCPVERTVAEGIRRPLRRRPLSLKYRAVILFARIASNPCFAGRFGCLSRMVPAPVITGRGRRTDGVTYTPALHCVLPRPRRLVPGDDIGGMHKGRIDSMRIPWVEGNDGLFAALPRLARKLMIRKRQ